ncbi:hypothetical protein [Cohnella soli]|uniref:Alpha-galactosidase n=1 Tax=Cohnella soli TaxID=425005 RepID=A0ABW0HX12_9BACL
MRRMMQWSVLAVLIFLISKQGYVSASTSGDAYINYDAGTKTWTLGTDKVEKKVQLNGSGQLLMTSFKNKLTNLEYVQGTQNSDEFQITVGSTAYNGSSTGWTYDSYSTTTLSQGELQLSVTIHNAVIEVTRYYIVFPYTGAIKEWSVFKNISGSVQNFSSPYMFKHRLMQNDLANVDLQYMTGGGNFTGSGILKSAAMTSTYARTFNSYDTPEVITVDGQNRNNSGSITQGTSVYDAFFALRNKSLNEGVWLSFDYNGHWYAQIGNYGTKINLGGYISMTNYSVNANASITAPKSIMGVFTGDVDDMGNTILDYTYRYLWDYTRGGGGGAWQWRVSPQMPFAYEAVKYARYVGGGTVHIDADWYNRKGDWQPSWASDDFQALNAYLAKSGMKMKVWSPFWSADYGSDVVKNHPDYLVGGATLGFYGMSLNLANEDAYNWMLNKANSLQTAWGAYQWRYDGYAANQSNGSDNDMLQQSNNFFRLLKAFKDANPNALIDGCSSGGEILLMEAVRFSDTQQLTDGNAMHYAGYYQSLKLPLDKLGHTFYSETGLASARFNFLDEITPTAKENSRKFIDFYKYLGEQGLAGRWVKVYRPTVTAGYDQTYVIQKTNKDQDKAMLMFSSFTPFFGQNLTVYPKGLLDGTTYTVRCPKGSCASQTNTGAYFKTNGISLSNLQAGEAVLFNVTNYPGSGTDSTNPTAPGSATKKSAINMGKFGIELNWTAATDNNWLSYYEIERNGVVIDKVAKGTFYFYEGGSTADTFKIRTVDGDGNTSAYATASLLTGGPSDPGTTPIPNVYQASTGFSSVQGQGNWAYLQQYTPIAGISYWTNMEWDAANSLWKGDDPYARIAASWMHPEDKYNAVRKWVAPKAGKIMIKGSITLSQPNQGGDGVVVRIKKGGEYPFLDSDVWGPVTIPGTSTTATNHHILLDVRQGEALYFIVNKNVNYYFDGVNWDPFIAYGDDYQASANFSSTQGSANWYYQEWNGTAYSNLATYDAVNQQWVGSQPYVLVMKNAQHPDTNDSVRKWVAPANGYVNVKGNVRMYASGGDGVKVTIKQNNTTVWGTQTIAGTDTTTGIDHDFTVAVAAGDALYFIVNKNGNNYFDSTLWDPRLFFYQ